MASAAQTPTTFGTIKTFVEVGTCSETLCKSLNAAFDDPSVVEEKACEELAGGIFQRGDQCGILWGSVLAAGARAFRLHGAGPNAEWVALKTAGKIVERFRGRYGATDCRELIRADWKDKGQVLRYYLRGGPVGCFLMVGRFSRAVYPEIVDATALDDTSDEGPEPERRADDGERDGAARAVSCTAELAKRMGRSGRHAVMAAGLAGGIGLSGGACGALGAALWLRGLERGPEVERSIAFDSEESKAVIERFEACAGCGSQCKDIVGRHFEDLSDHATHIANGGCRELITALAEA